MNLIDWIGLGFFLFVFFIAWPVSGWIQIRNWERRHPGRSWWDEP
jgi:hypothetical protein